MPAPLHVTDSRGVRRPGRTALAVVVLLAGCGPTAAEVGTGVLVAAPFVFMTLIGVHALLQALWRRRYPDLRLEWRVVAIFAGALAALALGTLVAGGPGRSADLAVAAYLLYGATCLTLDLVVWRIWFARQRDRASTLAAVVSVAALTWPAPILVMLGADKDGDFFGYTIVVYLFGSGMGIAPAVLLLGALLEALVRRRHVAPDDPLPATPPDPPDAR